MAYNIFYYLALSNLSYCNFCICCICLHYIPVLQLFPMLSKLQHPGLLALLQTGQAHFCLMAQPHVLFLLPETFSNNHMAYFLLFVLKYFLLERPSLTTRNKLHPYPYCFSFLCYLALFFLILIYYHILYLCFCLFTICLPINKL